MSTIIVRSRRGRKNQPRGPVEIDWSNPFAAKLLAAIDLRSGYDYVTRSLLVNTGLMRTAGRFGVAASTGSVAGTGILQLPAADRYRLVGTPCTIFSFCTPSQTDPGIHSIWSVRNGSTQVSQLTVDMASGASALNFTRGGIGGTGLVLTNALNKTFFALAMDSNSTELYTDNQSSTQAGGVFTTSSIQPSLLNRQTGGRGWAGNAYLTLLYERKYAADEIRTLRENPYQMLRARRRVAYFLGASAGSTLSLAAAGAAQSTGAAALAAQVALSGIGVALAAGQAAAAVNVPLAAAGITVANGQAGAVATVAINASGIAQAAALAGLSPSVLAQAAGAVQAAGNAQLAVLLNALAAGAGNASGSANLTGSAPGSLLAAGQASAQGNAALAVTVQLQAVGAARADAAANGSASAPGHLSAVGTANASGWAAQSILVNLTAAGFVHAMVQGALSVEVPLGAAGVASVSGSAQLGTMGPVRGARLVAAPPQLLTQGITEAVAVTSFLCEAVHV